MRRSIVLGLGILVLMSGAGLAAPSEEDQKIACTGDALRLCAVNIPDHGAIEHCMAAKHDQLSDGCRVVFDASAPTPAAKKPKRQ